VLVDTIFVFDEVAHPIWPITLSFGDRLFSYNTILLISFGSSWPR
jgi:hypothetical protein